MLKQILSLVFLANSLLLFSNNQRDSQLKELDQVIINKKTYFDQKQSYIDVLSNQWRAIANTADYIKQYNLSLKLYNEYESFIYDSAYTYIIKAQLAAENLKDKEKITYTKIKTSFILLSCGMFKESLDSLKIINPENLPDSLQIDYFSVISRTYYDLADYVKSTRFENIYNELGNKWLDKALQLIKPNSSDYWAGEGLRRMKGDDLIGSKEAFEYWINHFNISEHEFAIAASSLGYLSTLEGQNNKAVEWLIKSAIADIKSSTKETVALRNLSDLLYKEGDIPDAYRYINQALDDASFYNARHRKVEITKYLPIIEDEKMTIVERQKTMLEIYAGLITLLILIVVGFIYVVYRQLKNLKKAESIIQGYNNNLLESNNKLQEANKIKEEYIGYFFTLNAAFIERMESFQKLVHRKIIARQYDDLSNLIKSSELRIERENLFLSFDKIFLKLFPNFVHDFNALFKEEDRFVLGDDNVLSPELRIYALIRLGIKDHEKIAKFLDYSVNTIYTYKTKMKSKSIYREQFDDKVMEIRAVQL